MTTVNSKQKARPQGDPPLSVYSGSTLVDDMEIIRKICLPEKSNTQARNASHLTFGKDPGSPWKSMAQQDFSNPTLAHVEPKSTREARCRYMNSKHFDLGFNDDNNPLSENRSTYVRHGPDCDRKIFNIGAPHNKNASSFFTSPQDRGYWANDIESSNRTDFVNPGAYKRPAPSGRDRQNHFDFGTDVPDYKSTHARDFTGVPQKKTAPLKAYGSAVQLGDKDFPWKKHINSTSRADYCAPFQAEEDTLTDFVKAAPFKFGDDPTEMLTENRSAYKKNEFLDCSKLTDHQLTMLGVTREQIVPRKVPLPFLSASVFKNSLGQSFANQD